MYKQVLTETHTKQHTLIHTFLNAHLLNYYNPMARSLFPTTDVGEDGVQ